MLGVIFSGVIRVAGGADLQVLWGCILGAAVIIIWTATCSILIFLPLSIFNMLRVTPEIEMKGLDETFHGGLT